MNKMTKILTSTGVLTWMVFSATALPTFAADKFNHHQGHSSHNHPPFVHKVDKEDYKFEQMYKLPPGQRKKIFDSFKEKMKHSTPKQRQEMKARWEKAIKHLPTKQREAISIDFHKIGIEINIK